MIDVGSVGVRIIPNLTGFGASIGAAVAGSGSILTRAGASASLLVTAPIVAGLGAGINQAVNFESAFAEVKKTVNATDTEYAKLRQQVIDMSGEMPFSRETISAVMAAAGKFGIANDNLAAFTATALKLGTATGQAPEQVAEQVSKLMNLISVAPQDVDKFLSSIVNLGNDMPTTEANIISMGLRIGQIRAVAKASPADITGMAAALTSLGIRAEAGGSAISRVFFNISDRVKKGGDDLKDFTDAFGLNAEEFAKKFESDPTAAVTDFLTAVRRLSDEGANVPAILKEFGLGEIRVRDTILRASQGLDTWNKAQDLAHDGFDRGIALQVEYEKRLNTTEAQWTILKNRAGEVALIFGTALLPMLLDVFDAVEPLVEMFAALAEEFSKMDPAMQQTIITFALILASIGPMLFIGSKLIAMFGNIGLAFVAMGRTMMAHPILLILMLIALAVYEIYKHWEGFKKFWQDLWDDVERIFNNALDFIQGFWYSLAGGGLTFPTDKWEHIGQEMGLAIQEGWTQFWGQVTDWYAPVGHVMDNVLEGVGEFWSDVDNTFHHWADPVFETWQVLWEDLGFAAVFNGDNIRIFIDTMWGLIQGAWSRGSQFLVDTWNVSWPALQMSAGTSFNWLQENVFSPIADYWGPRLSAFASLTAEAWGYWWPYISSIVGSAWTSIKNWFVEMFGWFTVLGGGLANLWSLFDRAWQAMPIIVHTAIEKIKADIRGALGVVGDFLSALAKVPGVGLAGSVISAPVSLAGYLAGKADDGGIVPGLRGQPQLILAHGGETILPTHKATWQNNATVRHVHFHQEGNVYVNSNDDILALRRAFYDQEERDAFARGEAVIR